MKEIWKTIIGEEHYQVSNLGRVRRVAHTLRLMGRWGMQNRRLATRIHNPSPLADGYLQVKLPNLGSIRVQTLVATAFLGPPPFRGAHANHIDNDKSNNAQTNLEWTTPSGNALHSFRTTDRVSSAKGKFGKDNPSSIPVIAICMRTRKKIRYAAAADAVRRKGFTSSGISIACAGKRPFYRGYYWRYERGFGR